MPATKSFFDTLRAQLFGGKLSLSQVAGLNAIVGYYESRYSDKESLAYVLATCYHESARTMTPVREYGRGRGYDYGQQLDMGQGPGKRMPYTSPNQLYYGRGLVQLTWRGNYARVGQRIGVDLLNYPDRMLELDISVKVLVEGMVHGWFTGRKLADYFLGPKADAVGARRIINGQDRAELIAGYYGVFLDALI